MADLVTLRLKDIDERSGMIVNGFIRESQNLLPFDENPYYNLTDLIVQICLIYYAMNECWDVLSDDFITEEDRSILKKNKGFGAWGNSNYGKLSIPSKGDYAYEWHIKINQVRFGYAFIGIADADKSKDYMKKSPGLTLKVSLSLAPDNFIQLKPGSRSEGV